MLVEPARGLFVVADGMGGHNAGEVASGMAVRIIGESLPLDTAPTAETLVRALRLANDTILAAASERAEYDGMGTTVVAAQAVDDRVLFGSVGDSRVYLLQDGRLSQLTEDDSWISRVLPPEARGSADALEHPMRHVLTKVVGVRADLSPSVGECAWQRGDTLLLCSDGLHGTVSDAAIADALAAPSDVDGIAQRLVDRAIEGGATDNVTAVVVRRA